MFAPLNSFGGGGGLEQRNWQRFGQTVSAKKKEPKRKNEYLTGKRGRLAASLCGRRGGGREGGGVDGRRVTSPRL